MQNHEKNEALLNGIIAAYLEAKDKGHAPDPEQLLRAYPQYAAELKDFFDSCGQLELVVTPVRRALEESRSREANFQKRESSHEEPPGSLPTIDGYEILAQIGRGAMGVVYRAQQLRPSRLVALKMILGGPQASADDVRRFRLEIELAAQLDHPNIVSLLEAGEHGGALFFTMQLIDGGSLANQPDRFVDDPRQAARTLSHIAHGVHHANERGVLHRDLKPSNILLDHAGQPHVTDFGLAKQLNRDAGLSRSRSFVGTPNYAAPEQAFARKDADTIAVDVYGLGAILYAMLSGKPPFSGETPLDTLLNAQEHRPESLRRANRRVDSDLETICFKCLEKDPRQRYASALAVAQDLERWLAHEPILARPISPTYRLWRWSRRHPARASAALLGVLLAIVSGTWYLSAERRDADDRVRAALREAAQANERASEDRQRILLQRIEHLRLTAHANGWSQKTLGLIREAASLKKDDQWRDQAAATFVGIDAVKERDFPNESSGVAISPSGSRLLMAGDKQFINGKWEVTPARLWDAALGKEIVSKQQGSGPVAFDDSGNALQLVESDHLSLLLWNVTAQRKLADFRVELPATEERSKDWQFTVLALSPRGHYVAAVARRGDTDKHQLVVWQAASRKVVLQRALAADAVAFCSEHPWLAVATMGETTIWSLADGVKIRSLKTGRGPINRLAFGRDPSFIKGTGNYSQRLATASSGVITIWDIATGAAICFCRGSHYEVTALCFSEDGAVLASAGREQAKLWDVATGRPILSLGARNTMTGIAFSKGATRLAVSSIKAFGAGGVDVWRLSWDRGIRALYGLSGQVSQVRFSPDGKRVAALAHNWQVGIWDAATGRLERVLDVPQGLFADNAALAFSADSQQFAFASGREAALWDLRTKAEPRRWPLPPGLVDLMGFHGDRLLLFRVETKDGTEYPASEAPAQTHPRVCRLRNLASPQWATPIKEITDFNWGVRQVGAPWDARIFVVQGIGGAGKVELTRAYDGSTGKLLWSKPNASEAAGSGVSLWFDPPGDLMTLLSQADAPGPDLLEMPAGEKSALPSLAAKGILALSPHANMWSVHRSKPRVGLHLFRRDDKVPVVILGLDAPTHNIHTEFNMTGTQVAWGNDDGSVYVCDVEQVRGRLRELGMGW